MQAQENAVIPASIPPLRGGASWPKHERDTKSVCNAQQICEWLITSAIIFAMAQGSSSLSVLPNAREEQRGAEHTLVNQSDTLPNWMANTCRRNFSSLFEQATNQPTPRKGVRGGVLPHFEKAECTWLIQRPASPPC